MSFPLPDNILQLPDVAARQIMKSAALLQNGDVSRAMKKAGFAYPINYGVTIPQLRNLATKYKSNKELARQLRSFSDIREALILSSMLDEPEELTVSDSLEICKNIDNVELLEQFSRNLFALQPCLIDFCKEIIQTGDICQTMCYMSVAWAVKFKNPINANDIQWVINQLSKEEYIIAPQISRAALLLMQAIDTHLPDYAKAITKLAEKFSKSDKTIVSQLGDEFLWLNVT